jgi:putative alpha-1,2-mannosidase
VGTQNLEAYERLGFVPHTDRDPETSTGGSRQEDSNALNYAYEDYCVAEMAKSLGKMDDYRYFLARAHNYRNQFDPALGYMWPRWGDGRWVEPIKKPFNPTDYFNWPGYPRVGFAEGTASQYTWFVPHDVKGIVKLIGREEFIRHLNEGFAKTRARRFDSIYVRVGNEPNMQAPFLSTTRVRPG